MKAKLNWQSQISQWDRDIREGRAERVRKEINGAKLRLLPRPLTTEFASVCRRADCAPIALKKLSPFIRANRKNPVPATANEMAEYAANLVRIGAGDEALDWIKKVDVEECPQVLLYKSYALASLWDYAAIIPTLSQFLQFKQTDKYQQMIARVNLAAAFAWQEPGSKVENLLRTLTAETRKNQFNLLYGNSLEILAQNAIGMGNWKAAEVYLGQAQRFLKSTGGRDEFFVRKWRAILDLIRHGANPRTLASLDQIKTEALGRGHWETIRQCELYLAETTKNGSQLEALYFGTPFKAFKARVLVSWKADPIPSVYHWHLGDPEPGQNLNLIDGTFNGRKTSLKPGRIMHRTLSVLASDFFRPVRTATLCYRLYPDEHYSLISSQQRIHFALHELRDLLKAEKICLMIEQTNGMFRLKATGPITLTIPTEGTAKSWEEPLFARLFEQWKEEWFSIRQASQFLGMPTRSLLRLLVKGMEKQKIVRTGSGNGTRYRCVKDNLRRSP